MKYLIFFYCKTIYRNKAIFRLISMLCYEIVIDCGIYLELEAVLKQDISAIYASRKRRNKLHEKIFFKRIIQKILKKF